MHRAQSTHTTHRHKTWTPTPRRAQSQSMAIRSPNSHNLKIIKKRVTKFSQVSMLNLFVQNIYLYPRSDIDPHSDSQCQPARIQSNQCTVRHHKIFKKGALSNTASVRIQTNTLSAGSQCHSTASTAPSPHTTSRCASFCRRGPVRRPPNTGNIPSFCCRRPPAERWRRRSSNLSRNS